MFEEYTKVSNSTNNYDAQSAIVTDIVGDLKSNIFDKIDKTESNIRNNLKLNNIIVVDEMRLIVIILQKIQS